MNLLYHNATPSLHAHYRRFSESIGSFVTQVRGADDVLLDTKNLLYLLFFSGNIHVFHGAETRL
jgi:hypothetical protein